MNNSQMTIAGAVLLVVVVAGIRIYARSPGSASPPTDGPPDPNRFMPDFANKAVASAAARGVTLDGSPASIKAVDKLLGQLHDDRVRGTLDDKGVHVAALRYGGYIGEVIRRQYGGSWATDHKVAGPQSFPISWNGHDSFPVGWCGKRILNGDEDNVWFKSLVSGQNSNSDNCL